jgi:hypothetical protein
MRLEDMCTPTRVHHCSLILQVGSHVRQFHFESFSGVSLLVAYTVAFKQLYSYSLKFVRNAKAITACSPQHVVSSLQELGSFR